MPYINDRDNQNLKRLNDILSNMPMFVRSYFNSISQRTSTNTRLGYAYDILMFFRYLFECHEDFCKLDGYEKVTAQMLEDLKTDDIEYYMTWLSMDHDTEQIGKNKAEGLGRTAIKRKISALSALYKNLYNRDIIHRNVMLSVDRPKLADHEIIRMNPSEVADLIDEAETGDNLSPRQQKLYNTLNAGPRDTAILTLLLGTGIRVSELVGIDLDHFDWSETSVRIVRKGGKEDRIYFGDEVTKALLDYKKLRDVMKPDQIKPGDEKAFFISKNMQRITTRSVERLVKKHARTITTKHITPHKCRSTYGTNLYKETGDVLLVSKQLGHTTPTVTAAHYTAMDEERKIQVKDKVKLRDT